ncbi:AAA-domain-containing protein [Xylariomycetidae sp. FL0641]|nr:AAA-domain-containing protein [Xylariomycetidae sp. FL0641]
MRNEFKVRLQPQDVAANQKNPNQKNAAKIFIHPSTFAQAGFTTAYLCTAETDAGIRREAVAWPAPDKNVANNIASISRVFQKAVGLELGQVIRLTPGHGPVPAARVVVMRETASDAGSMASSEEARWQYTLESRLETAEYILPGTPFDDVLVKGCKRSFVIESVNGRTDNVAKYDPDATVVEFFQEKSNTTQGELKLSALPAMENQVKKLNRFFDYYYKEFNGWIAPLYTCGIIIDGSRGTGKSMLLDNIAATNWGRVVRVRRKDKPSMVETHIKTALEQRTPTIILIDNLSELIGKEIANRTSYIDAIGEGLDALAKRAEEERKRPNVLIVASCLDYLEDVPDDLKEPGRFESHVTLSIPDVPGRKEIIRYQAEKSFDPTIFQEYISKIGEQTHAYTGADLRKVLLSAANHWADRVGSPSKDRPLIWDDISKALQEIRPSAMNDINLKPPTIHWSDIGGYEDVKAALSRVFRRPEDTAENKWEPTKGVLLYGPPGCSKTMTAQAIATESDFNFFAVKGGELLNMYVGETERSIRNLFKRAQEASPSIIFFDEIDSLAGARSSGASGTGGVQAVTTMLTEMDGFEQRGDIFVLAATNKPDALDPALLRPGRFDELIYVPLPDTRAREAIITSKARALNFSSDIDLVELARVTDGFSGAEISKICAKAFLDKEDGASNMETLTTAVKRTPRGVSEDILSGFSSWRLKR